RFDRERTVVHVLPASDESRLRAIDAAIESECQLARLQAGVVEYDRPARADDDGPVETDVRTRDIGERGIGHAGHASGEIRRQSPGNAVADHEADLRAGVDRSEVLELDAARLDRSGKRIA